MLFLTAMIVGLGPEAQLYLEGRDDPSYWENAVPGRGVVVYENGTDLESKSSELTRSGATIIRVNPNPGSIVFTIPEKTAEATRAFLDELLKDPQVLYAEPDFKMYPHYVPDDPYWNQSGQWGVREINADDAWDYVLPDLGDTSVKIAIVDQGVYYTHPDLNDHYGPVKGWDAVDNDSDPWPGPGEYHGTWTSGIAAAETDNGVGMAGIGNSGLFAVRTMTSSGGYMTDIADGVYWAADHGADIISMSLGGPSGSSYMSGACSYAYGAGVYLAASSGNDGASSVSYPARYSTVVAVGATNVSHTRPSWSNYGPNLELCAPGVGILGCYSTNSYATGDGTSASCPIVTGAAGVLKAYNPSLTNQDIRDILDSTARDLGASGWDQYYGYGEVDLLAAIEAVGVSEDQLGFRFPVRVGDLSPSVASARAYLPLHLPGDRNITVSAYNAAGALVSVLHQGSMARGDHRLSLDISGWRAGSYMIVVSDGHHTYTRKLLKR